MPASLASSEVHKPAASTTVSASIEPLSVSTPVTEPSVARRNPVTVTPNAKTAPRSCAPLAKDNAASPGFTVASFGTISAPTRSSTSAIGHQSMTCFGSRTRASTSNSRCISALPSSSCIRPAVRATVSEPTRRNPVSTPVSSGSASYSGALMRDSSLKRVRASDLRHEPGRVPRRAARQARPLHDQHVGDPELREVVCDRGSDHTAADDHHLGARRRLREGLQDRRVEVAVGEVLRDRHRPEGYPSASAPPSPTAVRNASMSARPDSPAGSLSGL